LTPDETATAQVGPPSTRLCFRTSRFRAGCKRLSRVLLGLGLGLCAVVSFAVAGVGLALSRGPIDLDWLAPLVVQSLDETYAPRYAFGLKSVKLAATSHGPTLAAEGLTVKGGERVIVAAPRAELSIDFGSLLAGKIRPSRVEMLDLELRLAVMADGRVTLFAGAADAGEIPLPPDSPPAEAMSGPAPQLLVRGGAAVRALLDLVTSPDSVIGALDRVGVAHARLVIDDRALQRQIAYTDLSLSLDKNPNGAKFSLAASGAERRWSLVATAQGKPGARRVFDAQARNFSIDDIALLGGLHKLPFDSDSPLSADIHFALSETDRVVEAKGAVRAGRGFFRLDEPDFEPVMIDNLSAVAAWDKANRQFTIAPIRIKTGAYDVAIEGEISPVARNDLSGAVTDPGDEWVGALRLAKPGFVGPERAGQKPLRIDRASLGARLSLTRKLFAIERFEVVSPQLAAAGSAEFLLAPDLRIAFDLSLDNAEIEAVARLIPTHVAAPVRNWLFEHLRGGTIRHAVFGAKYTLADLIAMRYEQPPPDGSLHAEGDLGDCVLAGLLPGLPPVSALSGHARLTGRSFTLEDATAAVETGNERRLALNDIRFAIDDTALKPATPAALAFRFSGAAESVAEVLALPALAPFVASPIDPTRVKGQVDGRLDLQIEVGDAARFDHAAARVEANAASVAIDRFLGAERLESGTFAIAQDESGLRVTGGGKLYGGQAVVDLRRAGDEKSPTQAQMQLTLDEAARAKAGFPLPNVTGPVLAQFRTTLPQGDADTQVEIDLTRASLDNALPGLVKPAGKPAKASFTLVKRGDGLALDRFALEAGTAQISGVIEVSREGAFRSAKFAQFRLSPGDDLKLDVQRSGETLRLAARGVNFDARPLLRALVPAPGAGGAQQGSGKPTAAAFDDVDLDAKSSLVTGNNKQILTNVELKWERRGARSRAFTLTGDFGRDPLAVALAQSDADAPLIKVACGDGGSLLSFFDIYSRMESGALNASIGLGRNGSDGAISVQDFFLRGEPAMRQLMSQGAHRADEKGAVRFDPELVRVARLQSRFGWSNGRLSVGSGIMSGPEMGLTFDGYVDFVRDRVDVTGAYVPLYGLNNLVGGIPVLGELFAGGAHEGVLALNYSVLGPVSAPTVSVKPLSLFTPGMLRKLMSVFDGTARPQE
jgi:hypothetical protein